ncbi:MAG: Tetratricopeptide repeat [Actinomycetia bacterium]|nr:Tetratricopeptide repeat [Actinomycetes bacterium]
MGRSNTVMTLAKLQTVGRFGHASGRYDEALADLDHAIELNPEDAYAIVQRGETCRGMGCYGCRAQGAWQCSATSG